MSHANLMSLNARTRECIRSRIRQWLAVLGAAGVGMAALTIALYVPCLQASHSRELLELRYKPVRQLRAANEQLAERIERIEGEEKFALGLSQKTPMVTLLGLVGECVAESGGKIFVDGLAFENSSKRVDPRRDGTSVLELAGKGTDAASVHKFVESLQTVLPFSKVQLIGTKQFESGKRSAESFTIECSF